MKSELITLTRHGTLASATTPIEAAELARKTMNKNHAGLLACLQAFPSRESERDG